MQYDPTRPGLKKKIQSFRPALHFEPSHFRFLLVGRKSFWSCVGTHSMASDSFAVDAIIEKLLSVRGARPGKQVQLAEDEIRGLCQRGKDVFLSQPMLLELEAPLKICGGYCIAS